MPRLRQGRVSPSLRSLPMAAAALDYLEYLELLMVEEVFPNKGKLYGGHTGKEYKKSETEEINGIRWSKPECKDEKDED